MSKKDNISRRAFLKDSVTVTVGASILGGASRADGAPARRKSKTGVSGVAMVTSRERDQFRVDLLSLRTGDVLKTWDGFFASHAVVPVEALNRFFVHGVDGKTRQGS